MIFKKKNQYIYNSCNIVIANFGTNTFANTIMWYIGLDDIWKTNMSNTYDDTNVCRYALGHRDVVYSLGKTQNVTRNVIAISIGDIAEKAAILYGNYDGHNGKEGDYTEYHHVGFDVVANRIFESVMRYADKYDDKNRKVYWITGEGGGGSVVNLLAKKLIDKYGSDRVYAYTFNALNTINIMDIPEGKRISNEKYRSIYNLYNDDNQTINLFNNKSNFYMYGITKHASIMNNATYRDKWKSVTGINYHVTTKTEYAKEFLNMLYDELNGITVRPFFASEQEKTIENFINELKETNDPKLFTNLCTDIIAYFFTLGPGMKDLDFYFEDPNDQKRYEDTRLMMEVIRNEKFSLSTHETGGLIDVLSNQKSNVAVTYSKNGVREKEIEDNSDPRDGTPFVEYDLKGYKNMMNLNYNSSNECVRVGEFAYSNYTVVNKPYYDIDYSKFWSGAYDGAGKDTKLFEYKMGDIGEDTEFTFTDRKIANSTICENNIQAIDNRIVAAFPIPVFSKDKEDISYMHRYNNYEPENVKSGEYRSFNGKGGMNEDTNIKYNLVDVVMEKYDENGTSHQFVVPFVVIDTKWLHQSKEKEMYSMFTDNRYGQVTESITTPDLENRYVEGDIQYVYEDSNGKKIIEDKMLQDKDLTNKIFIRTDEVKNRENVAKTVNNTYPCKTDIRKVINCSPIEPYTDGDSDNTAITKYITNQVLPTMRTRIVSIRVYDVDYTEQLGGPNTSNANWKWNINTNIEADDNSIVFNEIKLDYFDKLETTDDEKVLNKIVIYPSINNSE